jgi:hypothetical protein
MHGIEGFGPLTMWLAAVGHGTEVAAHIGEGNLPNTCTVLDTSVQGKCAAADGAEFLPPGVLRSIGLYKCEPRPVKTEVTGRG